MSINIHECQHEETSIRRKLDSMGRPFFKRQCHSCGRAIGEAIKQSTINEPVQDWDVALEQRGEQAVSEVWQARSAIIGDELRNKRADWWQWYNEYLASPEWQDRRMRVLQRDNYVCQACLRNSASEVHHLTYRHVGDEPLFDLVSVCYVCHKKLTAQERAYRNTAGDAA